ncbi:unnamed protein product [Urochloa humidicola]
MNGDRIRSRYILACCIHELLCGLRFFEHFCIIELGLEVCRYMPCAGQLIAQGKKLYQMERNLNKNSYISYCKDIFTCHFLLHPLLFIAGLAFFVVMDLCVLLVHGCKG